MINVPQIEVFIASVNKNTLGLYRTRFSKVSPLKLIHGFCTIKNSDVIFLCF